MSDPKMTDAFYESVFAMGNIFYLAAENGRIEKSIYNDHKEFWDSTNNGVILTLWCHFVETYYGNRSEFINRISDALNKDVVQILFYIRNAFIHLKWDISKLDPKKGQEQRIRNFIGSGYTHPTIKPFKLSLNGDIVFVEGLLNIGHFLIKEAES